MQKNHNIRVLVAGLEPSDRKKSVQIMASVLRDAGMEVVYAGNSATPMQIVTAAVQEDVRAIGVWLSDSTQGSTIKNIAVSIEKQGIRDMVFIVCGGMTDKDIPDFEKMGTQMGFFREPDADEMIQFISNKYIKKY